jgi:hypothetical protein
MKPQQTDRAIRDLRTALKVLSDQSLKTSRHLDDTYYSILEKVSVLRQTIGSLQELSGLTRELHENFESDTTELIDDVQGQFDHFENFDTQQQNIIGLEDRIHVGKEKADSLTDRLAKAKERVDARAQAELEWETKNTRTILLVAANSEDIDITLQVAPASSGESWAPLLLSSLLWSFSTISNQFMPLSLLGLLLILPQEHKSQKRLYRT